ncbi:hypothetical protein VKT23_010538 [Stygiomarasmius scandens]|uniref:Uncharacterized protein n=1 Tax=Marasmiellus scandens TaxID=2682957 RepID=A0ABR1JH58_9AGAR
MKPLPDMLSSALDDSGSLDEIGVSTSFDEIVDDIEVGEDAFTKVPADQFVLCPDGPGGDGGDENEDGVIYVHTWRIVKGESIIG